MSISVFVAHKQINIADSQETTAVQNVLLVDRFLWLLAFNKTGEEREKGGIVITLIVYLANFLVKR